MKRPALFLDRDGVINEDYGYVYKPVDIKFLNGIFELVNKAKRAGYLVVVVTNQSGIGRGYYSESDFHDLMEWMKSKFVERDGQLDAIYFCPYHPEQGIGRYLKESDCRKPAPGMFLQAQRELDIDMRQSLLIGDKPKDVLAGRAAGVGMCFELSLPGENTLGKHISQLSDVLPFISCN